MRGWLTLVAVIVAATVAAQDPRPASSLKRPFSANGRVKLDQVAGDYSKTK